MCAPCLSPMTWTTGMQSNNRNDCGGHRRSRCWSCCSRLPGLLENMWWRNVVQSRKAYTIITMKLLQMTWTTGKTGINVTVVENTGRIDVGPDYLDYWKRTRGSTTCKWKEGVFRDLDYWKIREMYCEGIVGLYKRTLGDWRQTWRKWIEKIAVPDELDYWGVNELFIEPCCQYRYTERRDRVNDDIRREAEALRKALVEDQHTGTGRMVRARRWLWNFLEKPQQSIPGRVGYHIVTVTL